LSAKFALKARQNRELPVRGGATDIFRRELGGEEDDQETLARKLESGHLGDPRNKSAFLSTETELDPEIQAFVNQRRPSAQRDFGNFEDNFQATVNRIGNSAVSHLTNIQGQLKKISSGSTSQGKQLRRIHHVLNSHGSKFDALTVATQSQRAGQPRRTQARSVSPDPPPPTILPSPPASSAPQPGRRVQPRRLAKDLVSFSSPKIYKK